MKNFKRKTILLINAMSPRKVFILKRIKKMGVKIVCLDRDVRDFAKPYVDKWIIADLNNTTQCLNILSQYVEKNKIDGVLTFWEECVTLVSQIADEFNLPGIPYKASKVIKNKFLFRQACKKNQIPAPESRLLKTKKDLQFVKNNFKFPIIVKPIFGASSAFVIKVEKPEKLDQAYQYVNSNVNSFYLAPEWESLEIVAEEYIDGKEVDIDILVQNSEIKYITVNDNKATKEPFFVELGQWSPSILPVNKQNDLKFMASEALKKLGVINGCIHFEAKYSTSCGPTPIEINLRMGGGHVYLFAKKVWGVDLVENAVKISLGLPTTINKWNKPKKYLAGGQLMPNKTGKIVSIAYERKLKKMPYFVNMYFEKKPGDVFLCPPDGYDGSVGRLLVSSEKSIKEAKKNLIRGSRLIRYQISPLE